MATARTDLMPTRWTLIQRLKTWDDQESWREFFDAYWKLIYGTAIKSGLTAVEAQEVVQETIISVSRKIGEFEANPAAGSFKGWLLQLTRWRILDQVRKRCPFSRPADHAADTPRTPTTARVPDPAGLELDKVWDEEWQHNLISAALDRLQARIDARHYQIFYLYVIREVAVDQVAAATGVKPADVYLIKHRLMPLFEQALRHVERVQSP